VILRDSVRNGFHPEEKIAEAILATRFALASTTFATAIEGMEFLTSQEVREMEL